MSTLVCFHAHPDDEAIATAGTMAASAAAGHRVVLVCATRGEHGEVVEGVLDAGEQLGIRRTTETYAAAAELGVDRVEVLGKGSYFDVRPEVVQLKETAWAEAGWARAGSEPLPTWHQPANYRCRGP